MEHYDIMKKRKMTRKNDNLTAESRDSESFESLSDRDKLLIVRLVRTIR